MTNQKPIVQWNSPEITPKVKAGEEALYWIAVKSSHGIIVFSTYYQNRPIITDFETGDLTKECEEWILYNDCKAINSVGWMKLQDSKEYDEYYSPYEFCDEYKLLGWAEYTTPKFTGVTL